MTTFLFSENQEGIKTLKTLIIFAHFTSLKLKSRIVNDLSISLNFSSRFFSTTSGAVKRCKKEISFRICLYRYPYLSDNITI